jgi:4'-phosphopantetheinyl transferase
VDLKAGDTQSWRKTGGVDIWHFPWEPGSPDFAEAVAWTLSEEERVTAARFRDTDQRSRYITSHVITRAILASYVPAAATVIALAIRKNGKPYVAAPDMAKHLRFSMAHSGKLCVVAVAADREVGVDVERVRRDIALEEIAQMYFTARELAALRLLPEQNRVDAFFACWTRKEALLKAQGTGFLRPPESVHVGLGAYDPASPLRCGGWTVAELNLPPPYAGAVAVEGTQMRLRIREWAFSSQGECACTAQTSPS